MKVLILILALCFLAIAQEKLPAYGEIKQISGLHCVYVVSENEDSRKRISKALSKHFEVVNSPEQAEFFIEYSELSREAVSTSDRMNQRQQRSQMRAYVIGADARKIIIWSDNRSHNTEHFLGMKMYDSGRNESELTGKFLKALKKSRKS